MTPIEPGQRVAVTAVHLAVTGRTGTVLDVTKGGLLVLVDLHDGDRPWWVHRNNLAPQEDS